MDEVDDTRTTLEYAVKELEKDIEAVRKNLGHEAEKTTFSVFVLHVSHILSVAVSGKGSTNRNQNKDKEKKGHLPETMLTENRYLAAKTVRDVWICYPWEATDIEEHDALAARQAVI